MQTRASEWYLKREFLNLSLTSTLQSTHPVLLMVAHPGSTDLEQLQAAAGDPPIERMSGKLLRS